MNTDGEYFRLAGWECRTFSADSAERVTGCEAGVGGEY